uniref:ribonuclease D n=1 Tax=Candidatus Nanopelagicus sp. TaxID=2518620 RepID=UPI000B291D1F
MVSALLVPRNGLPKLIEDEASFAQAISNLASGSGPLAIDAERASGYRYSQRAYLIQIFRQGGGLHLVDPIPLKNSKLWDKFNENFSSQEWVIHASTQDLPCLIGVGLKPKKLFDTELGARIAGCERVGLGPLVESLLQLQLAKEHSAVDWSIRPLKSEWLNYAALDVDILLEIRDAIEGMLIEQNK